MGLFGSTGPKTLGSILKEMGAIPPHKASLDEASLREEVDEETYYHALAKLHRRTFIPPGQFAPQPGVHLTLHPDWVRLGLIPYSLEGNRLYLATDDPQRVQQVFFNLRNNYRAHDIYLQYVTTPKALERAKTLILQAFEERGLRERGALAGEGEGLPTEEEDLAGAGLILTNTIEEARNLGASDIHMERLLFRDGKYAPGIRFRVRGKLEFYRHFDGRVFDALVAKVKIGANLRMDERRLPQDGRISISSKRLGKIEGRVSVLPTLRGEEVVIRLLPGDNAVLPLEELIADREILGLYRQVVSTPYGIFLVTGPTGSGKSTTLAAMLKEIVAQRGGKILTVEDPVEYRVVGATQVQVQEAIGLTFARVLRSFLRQDPDVIMVGEIRDAETAKIAVEAALTGHLVLATLHVNNAVSVYRRLEQMGVERYKINDALIGASAQRLLPKLCPVCSKEDGEVKEKLLSLGFGPEGLQPRRPSFNPTCSSCRGKGYAGRVGVMEGFILSSKEKEAIAYAKDELLLITLEQVLRERGEGYKTMYERGLALVAQGQVHLKDLEEATYVL